MKDVENELNSDGLVKAIVKRALGYESKEIVEEYAKGEQGEIVLTKKNGLLLYQFTIKYK